MCRKVCFNEKNVYKSTKLFKEGLNSIPVENKSGRPSAEIVNSINVLILTDRRVKISEQLRISVGTAYKTLLFLRSVVIEFH